MTEPAESIDAGASTPEGSDGCDRPLFPPFRGKLIEIRIARLEWIAAEARMLLWCLPKDIKRWGSTLETRRSARDAQARAGREPDHPNTPVLLRISAHLLEATEHELKCWGECLERSRERWVRLERAVAAEMQRVAPELARIDRGAWPYAPEPSVYPWIKAVHDTALQVAADLRAGRIWFLRPVSLLSVSAKLNVRTDLVRNMLERNEMLVGGTARRPVAELEDVVVCYPNYAADLRRLAGTGEAASSHLGSTRAQPRPHAPRQASRPSSL